MARAQPLEAAEMIDIHFAGVPRHGFGEAEQARVAGAQDAEPQPQVGRQFAIVPGEAANIVAPLVPVRVIGVHDVAMVPEAIPAATIDFGFVEGSEIADLVLDPRLHRGGAIGQAPGAKDVRGMDAARFDHQLRRHGIGLRHGGEPVGVGRRRAGPERQFAGAGGAGRTVPAGFIILIGDGEPFILGVIALHAEHAAIGAHVHRRRIRRPEPQAKPRLIGRRIANVDLRRVSLPEIARGERDAALGRADIAKAERARARGRIDPGMAGLGALHQREAVGAVLPQRKVAPGRDTIQQRADAVGHRLHRHGAAGDLRGAHGVAGIAAKAGERPHGFGEEMARRRGEAHMPVMRFAGHRHGRGQA